LNVNLKILNPMAYLRFLRRLYRRVNGPAPLNDYPDYDEYWERRHSSGKNPGLLHRYRAIAALLPPGASVLDVGCGDGSFGRHLASVRPDCTYFGADISKAAIGILDSRGLHGAVIDPSEPLRSQLPGPFDVVTAMEVVEHVHDAEALMAEIVALSRKEVVITIPNAGFVLHRIRLAVFGRFPVTTIVFHMKEHIRFWTYKDFRQWVATFGLSIKAFIGQEGSASAIERFFMRVWPALFAPQVIYVLARPADLPDRRS
jgi:methionine biosynthesis protein MetW